MGMLSFELAGLRYQNWLMATPDLVMGVTIHTENDFAPDLALHVHHICANKIVHGLNEKV